MARKTETLCWGDTLSKELVRAIQDEKEDYGHNFFFALALAAVAAVRAVTAVISSCFS